MTTVASLSVEIGANINNLERNLNRAEGRVGRFSGQVGGLLRGALSGIALAGITNEIISSAIAWESAFAGVRKTVSGTDEELAQLEKELRQLATATDEPVAGLEDAQIQLANVAAAAGQLGVARDDIVEFTRVMGELGLSTNLTAEDAAFAIAQFTNITGTAPEDIERLGSTIVDLGNNFATTERDIVEFGHRLAGAGATAGLSEADILALGTAMASVGINAEAGGTAMTTVFNKMTNAVASGGVELDTFAKTAGMSADDFAAAWETDPAAALDSFIGGLGELDAAARLDVLSDLDLDAIRVSDTLNRLANSSDLVTDAFDRANIAWDENTALATEAGTRFETTESKLNLFKNNVNSLATSLGDILLPALNAILGPLNEFLVGIDIEGGLAAWEGVFANAEIIWGEIWSRINTAWQDSIVTPIKNVGDDVQSGLDAFKANIDAAFNWVIANVIDPMKGALQSLIDLINGALGGLGALPGAGENLGAALGAGATPGEFLNALGNAISMEFGGGQATGGSVSSSKFYMVGERGPELFAPGRSGTIIPNHAMGGGSQINVAVYGQSPDEVARMVERAIRERDL